MKKLIAYTLFIGVSFSFIPMFAKDNAAVSIINQKNLNALEKIKSQSTIEKMKNYGLDYHLCKSIIKEKDTLNSQYKECVGKITQAKYDIMLGKL